MSVVMVLRNDGSAGGALQLAPGDDVVTTQSPNIVLAAAVDGADLGIMLSNWGTGTTGDLNGDGHVDGFDLGVLLASWGACAP